MKKKDIDDGWIIDDFTPLLNALKKGEAKIVTETDKDPGVDYAAEFKKQTGRDLETGEYVTQ